MPGRCRALGVTGKPGQRPAYTCAYGRVADVQELARATLRGVAERARTSSTPALCGAADGLARWVPRS